MMQTEQPPAPCVETGSTECKAPAASGHCTHNLVIELRGVTRTLLRTVRMFAEAVMIPGTLFAIVLTQSGSLWTAVLCAVGWYYMVIGIRWAVLRTVPTTLVLCAGMFHCRATIALATASAAVYLLQPIAMSVFMATVFIVSAAVGRPLTVKLTRDFVHVPAHILARANVQKMFTHVALLWAFSRLLDAAVTTFMFNESVNAGMISRSTFTPLLTIATIGGCIAFGMRALRRDGVSFLKVAQPFVPVPVVAPAAV